MTEEPPTVGSFSKTTAESLSMTASQAAARPAPPAPMITTSYDSSHFWGAFTGTAPATGETRAAAPAAAPMANNSLRFMFRLLFRFSCDRNARSRSKIRTLPKERRIFLHFLFSERSYLGTIALHQSSRIFILLKRSGSSAAVGPAAASRPPPGTPERSFSIPALRRSGRDEREPNAR